MTAYTRPKTQHTHLWRHPVGGANRGRLLALLRIRFQLNQLQWDERKQQKGRVGRRPDAQRRQGDHSELPQAGDMPVQLP